ncbi:MAG: hypothetical protein HQK49_07270 [Oligoflexia bacterium]|nr:hypothetical protein [Oligoflexia bacterium]
MINKKTTLTKLKLLLVISLFFTTTLAQSSCYKKIKEKELELEQNKELIQSNSQSNSHKASSLLEDAQVYHNSKTKKNKYKNVIIGPTLSLFFIDTTEITQLSMDKTVELLLKSNSMEFICDDNYKSIVDKVNTGHLQKLLKFPAPQTSQEKLQLEIEKIVSTNNKNAKNEEEKEKEKTADKDKDKNKIEKEKEEDDSVFMNILGEVGSMIGKTIRTTTKIAFLPVTIPATLTYKTARAVCKGTIGAVSGTIKVLSLAKDVFNIIRETEDQQSQAKTQSKEIVKTSASAPLIKELDDNDDKESEDGSDNSNYKIIDPNIIRSKAIKDLISEADEAEKMLRDECRGSISEYYFKLHKDLQ